MARRDSLPRHNEFGRVLTYSNESNGWKTPKELAGLE